MTKKQNRTMGVCDDCRAEAAKAGRAPESRELVTPHAGVKLCATHYQIRDRAEKAKKRIAIPDDDDDGAVEVFMGVLITKTTGARGEPIYKASCDPDTDFHSLRDVRDFIRAD